MDPFNPSIFDQPTQPKPEPVPENYEQSCTQYTTSKQIGMPKYNLCFTDLSATESQTTEPSDCYKVIEVDLVFAFTARKALLSEIPSQFQGTHMDSPSFRGKLFVDFTEEQSNRDLFSKLEKSYTDTQYEVSINSLRCFLVDTSNADDDAQAMMAGANQFSPKGYEYITMLE